MEWKRLLILGAGLFAAGCGPIPDWDDANTNAAARRVEATKEADSYRKHYQAHHDGESLRWLLSHELCNGLSLDKVNLALGEEGEREFNSQQFKVKGGLLRVDDELYKYGPDNSGKTYYLAFRDGNLIQYDRRQYDDSPPRKMNPIEKMLNAP